MSHGIFWKEVHLEMQGSFAPHGGRFQGDLRNLEIDEWRADPVLAATLDIHPAAQETRRQRLTPMHAITPTDNENEQGKMQKDLTGSLHDHGCQPSLDSGCRVPYIFDLD